MKKINPHARYHETNEWVLKNNITLELEENIFTIGITDFAQTVFGKVISVNLPKVGTFIEKNKQLAIIESNKTTTEIESPMSGKIISINHELKNHPNWLNDSPYDQGWLVKIELTTPSEWENLMTAAEYKNYMSVFYNKI
ncbi:MAG: glycine cleavage system protein H [Saprospiraceae bacterium]